MSRRREWATWRDPAARASCQPGLRGLTASLVLSVQRATGPGHRDGVGHGHVLPFPASEVHEDGLAAAGEVAPGGVWPGQGRGAGCVTRGRTRGELLCQVFSWMEKLSWLQVSEPIPARACV